MRCGRFPWAAPVLLRCAWLVALFCGVTNCPITALKLAFELFHFTRFSFSCLRLPQLYAVGLFSFTVPKVVYAKKTGFIIDARINSIYILHRNLKYLAKIDRKWYN
jgi:hypothetical protein